MGMIYHIAVKRAWDHAKQEGVYRGDTLETEGFIHCSKREQVLRVANNFYRGRTDLVLLEIDETRVLPEIRYEGIPGGELFPHIYGSLNLDAVVSVSEFSPRADGSFSLNG